MNQQRSRRYCAAHQSKLDFVKHNEELIGKGRKPERGSYFDSNSVTPGTTFMAKVCKFLHFSIQRKITQDPSWQKFDVIISDCTVPGEGEHKIMEYIRYQKAQPDYDQNQTHCIYGLDADLIMLSLMSHLPHFSLLRDYSVFYHLSRRQPDPVDEFKYHLLHIGLLREYIEMDFETVKPMLKTFEFDLERIINDFVLIAYFVGNDFLPYLPAVGIFEGTFNRMLECYKVIIGDLDGYMTECGEISWPRVSKFLSEYIKTELKYQKELVEIRRLNFGTKSKQNWNSISMSRFGLEELITEALATIGQLPVEKFASHPSLAIALYHARQTDGYEETISLLNIITVLKTVFPSNASDEEVQSLFLALYPRYKRKSTVLFKQDALAFNSQCASSCDSNRTAPQQTLPYDDLEDHYFEHFEKCWGLSHVQYANQYYLEKFGFCYSDKKKLETLCADYIKGLYWNYSYYSLGCMSWSWYYPYYYAPMILDLSAYLEKHQFQLHFEPSKPFTPHQQLLATMPPLSDSLLPTPYRGCMTNPESPLYPYCPLEHKLDLNGKIQEWESVVILPFVDENVIFEITRSATRDSMTEEEWEANLTSEPRIYRYDEKMSVDIDSPNTDLSPSITGVHVRCEVYRHPEVKDERMWRDVEGIRVLNSFLTDHVPSRASKLPSIPTMMSIPIQAALQPNGTTVFLSRSQYPSLVLELHSEGWGDRIGPRLSRNRRINLSPPPVAHQQKDTAGCLNMVSIARMLMSGTCYVWPYHKEAHVVAVTNMFGLWKSNGTLIPFTEQVSHDWLEDVKHIQRSCRVLKAISIGEIKCLVRVKYLQGMMRLRSGQVTKRWATEDTVVPYQLVLTEHPIGRDVRFIERVMLTSQERFPPGSRAVCLRSDFFGQSVEILSHSSEGSIQIAVDRQMNLNMNVNDVLHADSVQWIPHYRLAKKINIGSSLLGQLCSYLRFFPGIYNFGLELRSFTYSTVSYVRCNMQESDGYMRKEYQYSIHTLELLSEYADNFPEWFEYLETLTPAKQYSTSALERWLANYEQKKQDGDSSVSRIKEKWREIFANAGVDQQQQDRRKEAAMAEASDRQQLDLERHVNELSLVVDPSDADPDEEPENEVGDQLSKKQQTTLYPLTDQLYKRLRAWFETHPAFSAAHVPLDKMVMSPDAVARLLKVVDQTVSNNNNSHQDDRLVVPVDASDLYTPLRVIEACPDSGNDAVDNRSFKLGDRVVYIAGFGPGVFGWHATVIGYTRNRLDLLMDRAGLGGSTLDNLCPNLRGISVLHSMVANISAHREKRHLDNRRAPPFKFAYAQAGRSMPPARDGIQRNHVVREDGSWHRPDTRVDDADNRAESNTGGTRIIRRTPRYQEGGDARPNPSSQYATQSSRSTTMTYGGHAKRPMSHYSVRNNNNNNNESDSSSPRAAFPDQQQTSARSSRDWPSSSDPTNNASPRSMSKPKPAAANHVHPSNGTDLDSKQSISTCPSISSTTDQKSHTHAANAYASPLPLQPQQQPVPYPSIPIIPYPTCQPNFVTPSLKHDDERLLRIHTLSKTHQLLSSIDPPDSRDMIEKLFSSTAS